MRTEPLYRKDGKIDGRTLVERRYTLSERVRESIRREKLRQENATALQLAKSVKATYKSRIRYLDEVIAQASESGDIVTGWCGKVDTVTILGAIVLAAFVWWLGYMVGAWAERMHEASEREDECT